MQSTSLIASRYPVSKANNGNCMREFIYLLIGCFCCCSSSCCRAKDKPIFIEEGYVSDSSEAPPTRDSDSDDD